MKSLKSGWIVIPVVLGSILYAQNARLTPGSDQWVNYVTRGIILVAGLVLLQLSLMRRGLEAWQAGWQSVLIASGPAFAALIQNENPTWGIAWLAISARGSLPQLSPILPALFFLWSGDLTIPLLSWGAVLALSSKTRDWLGWCAALGIAMGLARFGFDTPEITLVQWSPNYLYLAIGAYGIAGIFALSGSVVDKKKTETWRAWIFSIFALIAFSQSPHWGVIVLLLSVHQVAHWQSIAYTRLGEALRPHDPMVRVALMLLVLLLNSAETASQLPWDDTALPRFVAAAVLLIYAERRIRR